MVHLCINTTHCSGDESLFVAVSSGEGVVSPLSVG